VVIHRLGGADAVLNEMMFSSASICGMVRRIRREVAIYGDAP
jgi:hypothetical protein